ncbi:MAG TPA: 2-oxo acid dehydrogenase subunit E2 [Bryobacteraceae bacterium]|nr:2-oxo acid dehydrogenase subunit E2 [Bryobacteraceae bacterium]
MVEPVTIFIPRHNVNDDSVRILAWKVASGARVEKDQLICEVETSKAVLEIHAPESGVLAYSVPEGGELPTGSPLCTVFPAEMAVQAGRQMAPPSESNPDAPRLSAAARARAAEFGIDPSSFPAGRLVREKDVFQQAGRPPDSGVPIRWQDLPRRKVLEGRMLQRGRTMAVRSSITAVCRAKSLPAERVQPLTICEAARLLRKYPLLNAVHDNGRAGVYAQVNIGWALDGGQGLSVPVIPDADQKREQEIAELMDRQLEAYLESALSPADLAGGTFTVTDLSGQGAGFFEPLLVPGQAAILGIGKDFGEGTEAILNLTLAFDHQITEGRTAALFLRDLCQRLEAHGSAGPVEVSEPYCVLCHRDAKTLRRLKLVLLKSAVPPGLVCSLCAAGW